MACVLWSSSYFYSVCEYKEATQRQSVELNEKKKWQRNCYWYFSSTVNSTRGNWWNRGGGQGQQVRRWNTKTKESGLCCTLAWLHHFQKQRKKANSGTQIWTRTRRRFLARTWQRAAWANHGWDVDGCGLDAELPHRKHWVSEVAGLAMGCCCSDVLWRQTKKTMGGHTSGSKVLNQVW